MLNAGDFKFNSNYPQELERLVALRLINFDLWYLISRERAMEILKQLKMECDIKDFVPFARRGDNEDVACFGIGNDRRVIVYKQSDNLGYRPRQVFDSVWDWFRDAIEIMIAF